MLKRYLAITSLGLGIMLWAVTPAWATIQNVKSLKQAYPGKETKAYSCKTCHAGAVGKATDLNAYGLALQKHTGAGHAKMLTVEDYHAVEIEDPKVVPDEFRATPPSTEGKPSSQIPSGMEQLQAYLEQLMIPAAWAESGDAAVEKKQAVTAKAEPAQEKKTLPPTEKSAAAPAKAKAEYVGSETCEGCHTKEAQEFKKSTHARLMIPSDDIKAQGCESCHGPGSLHVEAGGGRGVGGIINPRKDPSTCFACHTDKKMEFRQTFHHPVLEGKMSCADCHNPHGEDVRPWSATTQQDINEACYKCHKDQRGPFVWEHEALREGCTTCHSVHGSINEKMLVERDANLCLKCHAQVVAPAAAAPSHSSRLSQGTCFSAGCHTAVHGSNFDAHLRY